ncbi:hypothetical protein G9A89_019500 [Geosiphon pyriformis]|nr:hypothetical protein G9A89_019500 [Geosiphon pyriformis]
MVVHQLILSLSNQLSESCQQSLGTGYNQNPSSQNYLSLLITPEDAISSKQETNQKPLTCNILPAASTEDESLVAIFPFELEKITSVPLFSGAALDTKPITMMYTNAKVNVDQAASTRIITADGATKTPIGKIDNFPFKVNSIIVLIKVLVIKATQYQALVGNNWFMKTNAILDWTMQELQLSQNGQHTHVLATLRRKKKNLLGKPIKSCGLTMTTMNYCQYSLGMTMTIKKENKEKNISEKPLLTLGPTIAKVKKGKGKEKKENVPKEIKSTETQPKDGQAHTPFTSCYHSHHLFHLNTKTVKKNFLPWEHGSRQTKTTEHEHIITANCAIANAMDIQSAKASGTMNHVSLDVEQHSWLRRNMRHFIPNEIWRMANAKVQEAMPSEILEVKNNPPEQINIILVPNLDIFFNIKTNSEDFHEHYQNLAPTRKEQEKCLAQLNTQLCDHCLISCDFQYCNKCDLIYNPLICMIYMIPEEEEPIKSIFNFNSNPNNDNDKNNGSSSIQNSNNNNNDSNSDSNFDSNYKQYIALSDLTKEQKLKWFSNNNESIMPEHVHNTDAGFDLRYPGKDVIKLKPHSHTYIDLKIAPEILATTMAYVIEPNEKIAQAIFLPLVKIAQLVSGFESTGRVDIPVNMVKEEIIDKKKIISTSQPISIPPYNQYMVVIERKVKDQNQIFEAEAVHCKLEKIGLINLHIPAKNYSHIKIPIYNNTGKVIEIPEKTIIGHLITKIEDQPPNSIPDFPQLCEYVDITSQTIYKQNKCYLLQPEQLKQIDMENLDPLQCMQLKILLNKFNDIFTSENEFNRTDIIQHQIKTGDAMPIKQ